PFAVRTAPRGEARRVEEHLHTLTLSGIESDLGKPLELVRWLARRGGESDVELDDRRARTASRVGHADRHAGSAVSSLHPQLVELEGGVRQAEAEREQRLLRRAVVVAIADVDVLVVMHGTVDARVLREHGRRPLALARREG